jgi:hypothetical protein
MNHRESSAIETKAPATLEVESSASNNRSERYASTTGGNTMSDNEALVVASKLKNYIKAQSGMNTSAAVIGALSDRLRQLCDEAIERAKSEGRKTVMDRDFG